MNTKPHTLWRYALPLLVGLPLVSSGFATAPDFPGRVLAYWSLDDDARSGETVRDLGPRGFDGMVRSQNETVPYSVPGIRGQALCFPAGHESWIEVDRRFRLTPPFTLAVWVKVDSRRNTMELLGQKAHSWREGIRVAFSTRQFVVEYGDGAENLSVRFDPHQTNIGQWVFLAVVHTGEEIALYVDCEEVCRAPAPHTKWSDRPVIFGNYVIQKDVYRFVGTLDEIVILEEALDARALAAIGKRALERSEKPTR